MKVEMRHLAKFDLQTRPFTPPPCLSFLDDILRTQRLFFLAEIEVAGGARKEKGNSSRGITNEKRF